MQTRVSKPVPAGATRTSVAPVSQESAWQPQVFESLLHSGVIQAKLTVSQPDDPLEREADQVADEVMRMPTGSPSLSAADSGVQRKCACGCKEEETKIQTKEAPGSTPSIAPQAESHIESLRGSGQPLPGAVRSFFEPRFGRDLGGVRVHTGSQANKAASEVQARAFTLGMDVIFGAGQYAPQTEEGQRLLAHELAHVGQQQRSGGIFRQVAAPRPAEAISNSEENLLTEILPAKVGALASIDRELMLLQILGEKQLRMHVRLIYQDQSAVSFTRSNGVPGVIALYDTRRGDQLRLAEAEQALKENPDRYKRESLERLSLTPKVADVGRHLPSIPTELRSPVNLGSMSDEELANHHDRILKVLGQLTMSTSDTDLLTSEAARIGVELARRKALAAGHTFGEDAISRMKQYFVQNSQKPSKPDENPPPAPPGGWQHSCIIALNNAMKIVTGKPALPTTPESIEKTMARIAKSGHSGAAREIWFKDTSGKKTKGARRPEQLEASVWDTVISLSGGDPGWSVFTMSLDDGNHSVTLTLDAKNPSMPQLYWSDQWESKGGWKEYTRSGLDNEVTRLVQRWWDEQKQGKKFDPVVRVWRISATPASNGP